ncbi:polyphosphate polymerase domain-containing protein [Portibacter lacus]|uniref:VTC domain-containing protein n=1 Tax=Portibacter lacus TaxID=1099794 RepID=A0AA37SLY7_9BACT|nr:polyphosphate polymerase domain-containing protein [Portibacter lacus]GLR15414.1 VTC domain-containing protein [Portibacter lacus]
MKTCINSIAEEFDSISLEEMDSVSLLKRTDTKFIIPENKLEEILSAVQSEYKLLEIGGRRVMNYNSLYFDTPEKKFYLDHHNGKVRRTKIRIREYVDYKKFFFEIKMKDGKGNTNKSRLTIPHFELELPKLLQQFIIETTGVDYDLRPVLWNKFKRMTLVNIEHKERATIDLDLAFSHNGIGERIPNLAIIELKQERYDRSSALVKALKKHSINPLGFSKYCTGMTKLYADLKYNVFKPKLLRLNKLTKITA